MPVALDLSVFSSMAVGMLNGSVRDLVVSQVWLLLMQQGVSRILICPSPAPRDRTGRTCGRLFYKVGRGEVLLGAVPEPKVHAGL